MSKQDRIYPRTAADIERRYNFKKTFDEMQKIAVSASESASKAENSAQNSQNAVGSLNQKTIINLLTNNGLCRAIFLDEATGELYLNASFLASGVIRSADGSVEIDLLSNRVSVYVTSGDVTKRIDLTSRGISGQGVDLLLSTDGTGAVLVGETEESGVTIKGKSVSWQDNGDGTYSLIGT